MIVQIMSDLHIHPGSGRPPPLAEGVERVVVAGDVGEGFAKSIDILRTAYANVEIALVPGNHEFYTRRSLGEELEAGRERAKSAGVHLTENDTAFFGSLRVVGPTYWTDYRLYGPHLQRSILATTSLVGRVLERLEADVRRRPTLILSHFPLTTEAVAPEHRRSMTTAAARSDLTCLLERDDAAHYGVFGHTHRAMDSRRGRTRLISNPLGHPGESAGFDAGLTFEVHP